MKGMKESGENVNLIKDNYNQGMMCSLVIIWVMAEYSSPETIVLENITD